MMKQPRKTGEWILIKQDIPVDMFIQPFSIFYALPTNTMFLPGENELGGQFAHSDLFLTFNLIMVSTHTPEDIKSYIDLYNRNKELPARIKKALDGCKMEGHSLNLEYQMKIKTKRGDVCIQPHEYTFVNDLSDYIEPCKDGHAFIKYIATQKNLKGKIGEQIFYLRTRGIGFADAVMMISGNIKTQNAFYIELHREYVREMLGEDVYNRTEARRLKHKNKKLKAIA